VGTATWSQTCLSLPLNAIILRSYATKPDWQHNDRIETLATVTLPMSKNTYFIWALNFHSEWRERSKNGVQMPARSLTFQTGNLYNVIIVHDSGSSGNLTRVYVLPLEIRFTQFLYLKIRHCSRNCTRLFHYCWNTGVWNTTRAWNTWKLKLQIRNQRTSLGFIT
jgi:hypothetical protein